jgi:ribosomal-protein-alanine N-acetyltransferase
MIETSRLRLIPIRAEVLTSLLNGDVLGAGDLLGFSLPAAFLDSVNEAFLTNQLQSIARTSPGQDWSVHAIIRQQDEVVIGQCGFHGPPEFAGRAEIGYTVFPDYRSVGYATEAVGGLAELASENGSKVIFASVSPDNLPSIRVVEKAGFVRTEVQRNKDDGEEYVFVMNL